MMEIWRIVSRRREAHPRIQAALSYRDGDSCWSQLRQFIFYDSDYTGRSGVDNLPSDLTYNWSEIALDGRRMDDKMARRTVRQPMRQRRTLLLFSNDRFRTMQQLSRFPYIYDTIFIRIICLAAVHLRYMTSSVRSPSITGLA